MNTQKPLKNKVSITLDEDVIRQIHKLAESDDRNFSQYINLILKNTYRNAAILFPMTLHQRYMRTHNSHFQMLSIPFPQDVLLKTVVSLYDF